MSSPDSPLTKSDLKDLAARLTAKRDELLQRDKTRNAERVVVLDQSGDDMDRMDASEARDNNSAASATDAALLAEIEHALRKIDEGSYGLDETSGEPIGLPRLRAVPWTRESIQTAEARERGMF